MKTLRGWQDVFTLSKHYQPAPRLHDGCQTSHPLDTLNDGNFTKKMPKKKTNALEVGTEIMHRISTRKRRLQRQKRHLQLRQRRFRLCKNCVLNVTNTVFDIINNCLFKK